jgi:hypothetical protein
MPDLLHSLQVHDLGHLRIVAELWGLELRANEPDAAIIEIVATMHDAVSVGEVIETLRPPAQAALSALEAAGGRLPWAIFARQFGDVREMGAGKRDREKPYLNAASAAEDLFYRALLGRAFFETADGAQEFAYMPDDCLPLIRQFLPEPSRAPAQPLGRAAEPAERALVISATDRILDDVTTLLAAKRLAQPTVPDPVLQALAQAAGFLKEDALQSTQAKSFLEASRADARHMLVEAWRMSHGLNELRLLPGLICEGEWSNRPFAARRFLLNALDDIPRQTWWNLKSFVEAIKEQYPDFQRPAGDYDSWFIRDAANGHYLRGFSDWDLVDGALLRFLMADVMHRLGLLDLALAGEGREPSAFRILDGENLRSRFQRAETGKLKLSSQGKIVAAPFVPRTARYQLARFCEWDYAGPDEYRYHISPRSLDRARRQGLKVEQLLALLARHADAGIPTAVTKAVTRWDARGLEARAEMQAVLRVSRPDILKQLRESKAARFLGESLGPTAVIIKHGAESRVIAALAELGILAEDSSAQISSPSDSAASAPAATQRTSKVSAKPASRK